MLKLTYICHISVPGFKKLQIEHDRTIYSSLIFHAQSSGKLHQESIINLARMRPSQIASVRQDLPQELPFKAPVFGGDQLCETWVAHVMCVSLQPSNE